MGTSRSEPARAVNSTVWRLFNLRRDQDDPASIDAEIRSGARAVGTNLWVLFFAILIASVGLNVNSTAVIVGAMLISPLMGPIVAIGYGTAVRDLALIRVAAKTLLIFTLLSLATSTLYFALSPLDRPGSELLARTTPTLWDVLIAAFGGAAGMVAATRRNISNVVPGVAIATALMPPLCTAGFGAAHGRWEMFGGAAYLFVINGVFIAAATGVLTKVLKLPLRGDVEPEVRRRQRVIIVVGIVAVMAPSVWLGYRFVRQEFFSSGAQRVVQQLQADERFGIVAQHVDPVARAVQLTTIGTRDEALLRETARALLVREGLGDASIALRRAGDAPVDLGQLRNQLRQDVDRSMVQQLQVNDAKLKALEAELQALRDAKAERPRADAADLAAEAHAQFPVIDALTLASGERVAAPAAPATAMATAMAASAAAATVVVVVELSRALAAQDRESLRRWLAVRLGRDDVVLVERVQTTPTSTRGKR